MTSQNDKKLMTRAGVLLIDAAGMLAIEAAEWRSRKKNQPKNIDPTTDAAWADKCERVARTNEAAADAMRKHAVLIAEAAVKEPA